MSGDEQEWADEGPRDRGCRWCAAHPGEFCEEDCGGPAPVLHPAFLASFDEGFDGAAPVPGAAEAAIPSDHVLVPGAALVHILDWHDKAPCGVGQESLDEIVFGTLLAALRCSEHCPERDFHEPGCPVLEATGRAARRLSAAPAPSDPTPEKQPGG